MRITRNNVFETNSSSTHAIVISKECTKYDLTSSWAHEYDFNRSNRLVKRYDEKLAYAYLTLKSRCDVSDDVTNDKIKEFKETVNKIFKELEKGIETFDEKVEPDRVFKIVDDEDNFCYIDHAYQIPEEFIERLVTDEDFLERFIFDKDSYVSLGGDEYRGYYIKGIGFEYDFEGDWDKEMESDCGEFWRKLKAYEESHDVYLKGN